MAGRYTGRLLALELVMIALAALFLVPLYFVVVNSVKPFREIMIDASAMPREFTWENYTRAWAAIDYPTVFANTLFITVCSLFGLVVLGSMAAWRLARRPGKLSNALLILFISAMVIPFQAIMIPLVVFTSRLGLIDSRLGLVVMYFGFGVSFTLFLYHGFVKMIPIEVEEAAIVDGCRPMTLFWRIVFPLLKPMTVTVTILNGLWIWNDFLLPLLVLHDRSIHTIQLGAYRFFAQYTKQWDLAMATLTMSITPIIVFFLLMQRHIIEGIAQGAVKG